MSMLSKMSVLKHRMVAGERRVKTWFAWWPVRLRHHGSERRWLKWVTVLQLVRGPEGVEEPHHSTLRWENELFVDFE